MFRFLAGCRGLRTRIATKSYTPRAYIILRARGFVNSQLKCGAGIRRRRREKAECPPRGGKSSVRRGESAHAKAAKSDFTPYPCIKNGAVVRVRPASPPAATEEKNESRPVYNYIHRSGKNSREKYFLISINNPDASAFSASVISKTATPAGV